MNEKRNVTRSYKDSRLQRITLKRKKIITVAYRSRDDCTVFSYYVIMRIYPLVALFESLTERINTSVRLEYCKTSYVSCLAKRTRG